MKLKIGFLFLSSFFLSLNSFSQKAKSHTLTSDEAKDVKKDAKTMMVSENYRGALAGYLDLYKTSKSSYEYNYRVGFCYLMTNSNKANAIPYLEFAAKQKDAKKEGLYFLGMAYMYGNRWDDAIRTLNEYKTGGVNKPGKDALPAERLIEMCENGKELTKHPVQVKFENLGKTINSAYEDYNPYISADGSSLLYTSRRKGNMGGLIEDLGYYTADVYSAQWKDSLFSKGKSIGAMVNTEWDEEAVGLSADGENLIVYFDNTDAFGDLGVSIHKGRLWQKPLMMTDKINSKAMESGASFSNDCSALYFASEKKDGQGGSDIYCSKRETTGDWGVAQNLGPVINTKYDEIAPTISLDGRTLFFCSRGHNSMGGFDIFKSTYDSITYKWSEPVNIGYPINTADDETSFSLTGNGRYAYLSTTLDGGLGDRDIYRLTFSDSTVYPLTSLISGAVTGTNGAKVELRQVSLLDKSGKKTLLVYKPYFMSNHYVLSAPPGEYLIKVEGYGFLPILRGIVIAKEFPPADSKEDFTVVIAK